MHESSGQEMTQGAPNFAGARPSPEFLAERAATASPSAGRTGAEGFNDLQAAAFAPLAGHQQRGNRVEPAEYGFDDATYEGPYQEQQPAQIGQEAEAPGASPASQNGGNDASTEAGLRAR